MERYLHGDFDRHIDLYRKAFNMRKAGTLRQHIVDAGIHDELPPDDKKAMARYILYHDISPVQLHGPKFGFNSKAVLKVLANTWLEEAEGPKTPNYGGNLSGRTLQATIRYVGSRTMRRLGFEGHTDKPWLYNPPAEGGVNNVDFGLSQLAFREAAKRLDMQPRVLQAILWFAEQKHYQKQGWEKWVDPAERDYRPMLRSLTEHGPLTTHVPGKEPAPKGGAPRAPTHKTVPKVPAFGQGGLVQPVQHFQDGGTVQPQDNVWSPFAPAPAAPGVVQPMSGVAPRAQAAAPRAEPVEEGSSAESSSTWDKILQQAAPKYTGQPGGTTTVFATPRDLAKWKKYHSLKTGDPGVGAPALGTVNTKNSFGVAVPEEIMTKLYGGKSSDPSTTANWRTARAQVTINGQTYVVPISDLGPGEGPRKAGRVTDFTSYLMKGVGLMSDDADSPVQIKLLPPGSGPDYLADRAGWNTEQENLRKQLFRPEPETTPWASPGGIQVQTLPGL